MNLNQDKKNIKKTENYYMYENYCIYNNIK